MVPDPSSSRQPALIANKIAIETNLRILSLPLPTCAREYRQENTRDMVGALWKHYVGKALAVGEEGPAPLKAGQR